MDGAGPVAAASEHPTDVEQAGVVAGDDELRNAYNAELKKITSDPKKYLDIVGKFGFTEKELPDPKLTTASLCAGTA